MTQREFSRLISSYIDYNTLLNAIQEFRENPNKALVKSVLLLGSEHISNAKDWNVYVLFSEFLKDFKIPDETLNLILKLEDIQLTDKEFSILKDYKFSGELRGNPPLEIVPNTLNYKPIIAISAESFILDILYHPANFLMNAIEVLSISWEKMRKVNATVFFEPSSPSELHTYIEFKIASNCEFLNKNDSGKNAGNSIFFGYRYVCLTHELPINQTLLSLTKDTSNRQAQSTL